MKASRIMMAVSAMALAPFVLSSLSAQAHATAPQVSAPLDAAEVLPICDRVLVAAMNGSDAAAALAAEVKDRPSSEAAMIRNVCFIYVLGAVAFMKHAEESRAKATESGGRQLSI